MPHRWTEEEGERVWEGVGERYRQIEGEVEEEENEKKSMCERENVHVGDNWLSTYHMHAFTVTLTF